MFVSENLMNAQPIWTKIDHSIEVNDLMMRFLSAATFCAIYAYTICNDRRAKSFSL